MKKRLLSIVFIVLIATRKEIIADSNPKLRTCGVSKLLCYLLAASIDISES